MGDSGMRFSAKPDKEYEWLEAQEAPECLEWVARENKIAKAKLEALPRAADIEEELKKLAGTNVRIPEFAIAGKLFRVKTSEANKKGLLQIAERNTDGSLREYETILDVDELCKSENKDYELPRIPLGSRAWGPDASRLLLSLSDGGADVVELREFDVEERKFVPGGFRTGIGRVAAAWLDLDHILINHALDGGPLTASQWPMTTYIWKRGTELKDAKSVYSIQATDVLCNLAPLGPTNSGRAVITRAVDLQTLIYVVVSLDGTTEAVDLPSLQAITSSGKNAGSAIVASLSVWTPFCGRDVPPGSVVAYDTSPGLSADQRKSVIWVPGPDEFTPFVSIGGLMTTRSMVHLTVLKRGTERRLVFEKDGNSWKLVRTVHTAAGSTALLLSGDGYSDNVVVTEAGLLSPSIVGLEAHDGTQTVLYSQEPAFNADDFIVEAKSVKSKDKTTTIDYVLLRPKIFKHRPGQQPVLMTGYGAFGLTVPGEYLGGFVGGISLVPWLKQGGSLVIPAIRGGGERGPLWHEAAQREKRQNSYDDFIAVAEKLISDGITTTGRIGVFGSSNGGLLSAVMGTQRPDLFGAVVSDVPLADMLRFPLMGMGSAWIKEYGDPQDQNMAKVLRSYSPFHNVGDGSKLPPFLVTVSTKDDRVGAGHARKVVAKLKDSGAEAYLIEESDGGHAVSDPFKKAKFMACRIAFFLDALQVKKEVRMTR